ncbi:hypothetical protein [Streptomyces umbrinus]|uniref:hypothetical protein n=1 Tax=Streptomyces umbrinus TaxID=67370 RepID=UPI0027D79730|nr:hypothetical protein [Streptomyces umbrinus]
MAGRQAGRGGDQAAATIARLRENTRNRDYAYYSDIAAFMAGLPITFGVEPELGSWPPGPV